MPPNLAANQLGTKHSNVQELWRSSQPNHQTDIALHEIFVHFREHTVILTYLIGQFFYSFNKCVKYILK